MLGNSYLKSKVSRRGPVDPVHPRGFQISTTQKQ